MNSLCIFTILAICGVFLVKQSTAQGNEMKSWSRIFAWRFFRYDHNEAIDKLVLISDRNCNECISEFDGLGGCACFQSLSCNHKKLVPKGCFHCAKEGKKYCQNKPGT